MSRSPDARTVISVVGTAVAFLSLVFSACSKGGLEPLGVFPELSVVAGTVRAPDGTPVADAVLTLEPVSAGLTATVQRIIDIAGHPVDPTRPDPMTSSMGIRATATDENGRFVFGDVDPDRYALRTEATDHVGATTEIEVFALGSTAYLDTVQVDIDLTPTGTFLGTATLENALDHSSTVVYVQGTSYVAVTDAAGHYAVEGVPVGTWDLQAAHPGYLDRTTAGTITAAGDSTVLDPMLLLRDANIAPVATAHTPTNPFVGLETMFSGAGADADGNIVLYEWDFEDDGTFDFADSMSADASHIYTQPAAYRAKLRVTDDRGAIGLDVVEFLALPLAVYVSATTGSPGATGYPSDPVDTITEGLALAESQAIADVVVAEGVYVEAIALIDGISVSGGHDPVMWDPQPGVYSVVESGTTYSLASAITTPTEIRQLHFQSGPDPDGFSSIAMRVEDSDNNLAYVDCRFVAGNGHAGDPGLTGGTGPNGGIGEPGQPGDCDGPNAGWGGAGGWGDCPGGNGGEGGLQGANPGERGHDGLCGGGAGGEGGAGGYDAAGQPGADGEPGMDGSGGGGGTSGSPDGGVDPLGFWYPVWSGDGGTGIPGTGGGGGGGGGGQGGPGVTDGAGNGGGGGGGGGAGGEGGTGGVGGSGSFAVFLWNASPEFDLCYFESGNGGDGGAGGAGGEGGFGGYGYEGGGLCPDEIGRGGKGGDGGAGGWGGGGAGGPGGPSFCIYQAGTSVAVITNPTFNVGSGGLGGDPGSPNGEAGSNGLSGDVGP